MGGVTSRDCGESICGVSSERDKDCKASPVPKTAGKNGAAPIISMSGVFLPNNKGRRPEEAYDVPAISNNKERLGEGAFGIVRKATNKKTKHPVAIKSMNKSLLQKTILSFQNEIEIQMSLDHPNIVRLFETFEDNKYVYIVLEICSGGELFDEILEKTQGDHPTGFSEFDVCFLMKQMMRAVYYMHSHGVCHRDLKPENFLLKERGIAIKSNTLKTTDFGISKRFKSGEPMRTKTGTAMYAAPELLAGLYTEKVDMWSSGVILYIMLSGCPPFGGNNDSEIIKEVKKAVINFDLPEFKDVTQEAKDMVKLMCHKDASDRPTAVQVMNSDWIKICNEPESSSDFKTFQKNFVTNLRKYSGASRFKKAALTILARHIEDDQIKELTDAFERIDANSDGTLTLEEMKQACAEVGLTDVQEVSALFERLDVAHEGVVTYSEFIAGMMDQKACLKEADLWEAFRVFDVDGNGTISLAELQQILRNNEGLVPKGTGERDIEDLFKEADTDGDGAVDFEEFKRMMSAK
jgi:calcium-dependent protein kinase